jgi:ATP-dependent Lon protease
VRSRAERFGLDKKFLEHVDVHVHVAEGAVPKDGPSAGVTMATAMVSALAKVPVRKDIAMTGEITLRGRVLPIGGLKEKLLAALRGGITTVLIPSENEKDIAELPGTVKEALEIVPVDHVDQVLARALVAPVQPIEWTDADEHAAEPPVHAPAAESGTAVRH